MPEKAGRTRSRMLHSIRQRQQEREGGGKKIASVGLPKFQSLHLAHVLAYILDVSCMVCSAKGGSRGMATSKHWERGSLMHPHAQGPEEFSAAIGQ